MSRIIYACARDPSQDRVIARQLAKIADRLTPDNLASKPPRILAENGVVACITNPSDLTAVRGTSVAAGHLIDAGYWDRPQSGAPDGAYAIFRADENVIEILTDNVSSRTVWYAFSDELFVAATSQRAIVALLKSFEFNSEAIPWLLANGTLGPGISWDTRIRWIPGATSLVLDRGHWKLATRTEPVRFAPDLADDAEHHRRVATALRRTVSAASVADRHWAIALSGGVDCRVILDFLSDTRRLQAITWGLRSSRKDRSNDAYIAPQVARHFGLEHRHFETDLTSESLDRVFERFIANGEGRIDHISGYADGFELWRTLAASGVHGILRGDEAFGRPGVRTPLEVRSNIGFLCWSDLPGIPSLAQLGLPPQVRPDWLEQQDGESLETWRDRLYLQYRIPFCLGALNDLKLPFVEVIAPLLANSVIDLIRQLPDSLRTDKLLLRNLAKSFGAGMAYATSPAVQPGEDILRSSKAMEIFRDSLSGNRAHPSIPASLIAHALGALESAPAKARLGIGRRVRRAIRARAPSWIVPRRPHVIPPPILGGTRLAFRTFLASRTAQLLSADAASLR